MIIVWFGRVYIKLLDELFYVLNITKRGAKSSYPPWKSVRAWYRSLDRDSIIHSTRCVKTKSYQVFDHKKWSNYFYQNIIASQKTELVMETCELFCLTSENGASGSSVVNHNAWPIYATTQGRLRRSFGAFLRSLVFPTCSWWIPGRIWKPGNPC